jgi:hypothetical protein
MDRAKEVVVVGCANLAHHEIITKMGYSYIGVDPHCDTDSFEIINSTIESFLKNRKPKKNYIIFFWFNVIAHINAQEVGSHVIIGDILINSTWSMSDIAFETFSDYYSSIPGVRRENIYPPTIFKRNRSLRSLGSRIQMLQEKAMNLNYFEIATVF